MGQYILYNLFIVNNPFKINYKIKKETKCYIQKIDKINWKLKMDF